MSELTPANSFAYEGFGGIGQPVHKVGEEREELHQQAVGSQPRHADSAPIADEGEHHRLQEERADEEVLPDMEVANERLGVPEVLSGEVAEDAPFVAQAAEREE